MKFFKKSAYDELVKKVNAIQTSDTSNLVKSTDYNTKFREAKKIFAHDHAKYISTQEVS